MHEAPVTRLRALLVEALRAQGEPLFLAGSRVVPAAALYASVQQARRRTVPVRDARRRAEEACPIEALASLLARLWEGGEVRDTGGVRWLPRGRVRIDALVGRCEARRARPRVARVDAAELAALGPEDALAALLFAGRLVHDATVAPGWDTLGRPARSPRT